MTVAIDLVTDIDAPVGLVYDLARDLDLHARSMAHTGERAIGGRTSGTIDLGETVTWRARHFGVWWTLTSVITVAEPPYRFVDEQARGPFAWFRHEHRFEERPGGTTRLIDHWQHASPLGPIGWLADRLVLSRHMTGLLTRRNAELKATAELAVQGQRPLVVSPGGRPLHATLPDARSPTDPLVDRPPASSR